MDFRFYNSSGCMSSSSNSSGGGSPDKKQQRPQRARAITGAHHFTNPQNVRRPLYQPEGKFLEEPQQPPQARPQQSLFWDVTLPKMQPIVDLPRPSQQLPVPMRSQFEPRPRPHFGIKPGRECKFCKNNGESKDQFSSHVLRNPNTGQLICPVLRSHICEMCGATGDKAHTRNYCPKVKEDKKNRLAIPVMLKKTMRQSDGQFR